MVGLRRAGAVQTMVVQLVGANLLHKPAVCLLDTGGGGKHTHLGGVCKHTHLSATRSAIATVSLACLQQSERAPCCTLALRRLLACACIFTHSRCIPRIACTPTANRGYSNMTAPPMLSSEF